MVITYQGVESFRIQFGDMVIGYNPVSKDSKFKATRFGADIVLSSLNDEDMNGVENCSFGDKVPFAITGPGEYETKGIFIKGFLSKSSYKGKERVNTIYAVTMENIKMGFLGALSSKELSEEAKEGLDNLDILFAPVGGEGVLEPADAYSLAVSLEPKIIIPMHFGEAGVKNALEVFMKEGGSEKVSPVDKLTLKKKDLEGKEGEIVVISPSA